MEALKDDKSYIREYRIRHKNGNILWVQEDSQIICNAKGDIDFVYGAFLDITERKESEVALREAGASEIQCAGGKRAMLASRAPDYCGLAAQTVQ